MERGGGLVEGAEELEPPADRAPEGVVHLQIVGRGAVALPALRDAEILVDIDHTHEVDEALLLGVQADERDGVVVGRGGAALGERRRRGAVEQRLDSAPLGGVLDGGVRWRQAVLAGVADVVGLDQLVPLLDLVAHHEVHRQRNGARSVQWGADNVAQAHVEAAGVAPRGGGLCEDDRDRIRVSVIEDGLESRGVGARGEIFRDRLLELDADGGRANRGHSPKRVQDTDPVLRVVDEAVVLPGHALRFALMHIDSAGGLSRQVTHVARLRVRHTGSARIGVGRAAGRLGLHRQVHRLRAVDERLGASLVELDAVLHLEPKAEADRGLILHLLLGDEVQDGQRRLVGDLDGVQMQAVAREAHRVVGGLECERGIGARVRQSAAAVVLGAIPIRAGAVRCPVAGRCTAAEKAVRPWWALRVRLAGAVRRVDLLAGAAGVVADLQRARALPLELVEAVGGAGAGRVELVVERLLARSHEAAVTLACVVIGVAVQAAAAVPIIFARHQEGGVAGARVGVAAGLLQEGEDAEVEVEEVVELVPVLVHQALEVGLKGAVVGREARLQALDVVHDAGIHEVQIDAEVGGLARVRDPVRRGGHLDAGLTDRAQRAVHLERAVDELLAGDGAGPTRGIARRVLHADRSVWVELAVPVDDAVRPLSADAVAVVRLGEHGLVGAGLLIAASERDEREDADGGQGRGGDADSTHGPVAPSPLACSCSGSCRSRPVLASLGAKIGIWGTSSRRPPAPGARANR